MEPKLSLKIMREDVRARVKGQVPDVYVQFATLTKGGSVVAAAIVLMDVFRDLPVSLLADRLFYFSVSVLFAMVPLITYRRGVIMATTVLSIQDYTWPMLMGIAEIVMFISLSGDLGDRGILGAGGLETDFDFRALWFGMVFTTAVCAAFLILSRLRADLIQSYDQGMTDVVNKYRKWIKKDMIGAIVVASVSGTALVLLLGWPHLDSIYLEIYPAYVDLFKVIAICLCLGSIYICVRTIGQFNRLAKMI